MFVIRRGLKDVFSNYLRGEKRETTERIKIVSKKISRLLKRFIHCCNHHVGLIAILHDSCNPGTAPWRTRPDVHGANGHESNNV